MNQTRRKPRILLFALLIVMIMLCGTVAAVPFSFAEEPTATEYETVTGEWYEVKYNNSALELRLSDSFSKYFNAGTGEVKRFADEIMTVLKEIFMNNLLSGNSQSVRGVNPIDLPIDLPDIPQIDDDFWNDPNLNQKLQGFKDMVEERLKDPNELDKYLEGEYNFMLEQAIGSYIEHKTESGEVTDPSEIEGLYQKIEEQIQGVVDKVVEEVAEELFKDAPEAEREELKQQFIEDSVQKSKDVVQQAATVVQENEGKAPEITAEDIMRELRAVLVEGVEVMSKENGLSVDGIKKIISLIPRPNEIAGMGQDEIRNLIKTDVLVVTTFGDVKLDVTFGFFGDTQLIQKAAEFLANHIDFSYAGGKLDLNINVPQVVSEMMLKITESASIPESTKKGIFAIFGRTGSENLEQLKGFTFEQFIDLLKSVDYRNMFNNLLNADFINTYFGNFFKQAIGHELTQKQIDNLIDKFADRAEAFAEKEWTYDDALDFLKNNVPGFNSIFGSLESATLEKVVNKLLSIVNEIDWAKYDAAKVHEMLSSSATFNDTIYSYIEQFADFENVYDTIIDYVEKAYGYLPQVFKDKSFIDMYDGNNDYSFNGTFDFNFKHIVQKVGSFLANHGFGSIGDAIKNAATTLEDKTTELNVNFTMNMPGVYKVEYVIGDNTIAGLLPEGADVNLFGDEKAEENYDVLYWIEEECGEPVEVMPARDVKLYAVTNFEVNGYVDDEQVVSIEKSYDGNENVLRAEVDGVSYAEYTYAWYKDDELIEDATENTFTVVNVLDSGCYKVVVTDKFTGYEVDTLVFDVKIDPASLDITYVWDYSEESPFTYDGKDHSVSVTDVTIVSEGEWTKEDIFDMSKLTYKETNTQTNVGKYTTEVNYEGALLSPDNFVINSETGKTLKWQIDPASIMVMFVWDYSEESPFTYDGKEHSVSVTDATIISAGEWTKEDIFEMSKLTYKQDANTQTNAGEYTSAVDYEGALLSDNFTIEAAYNSQLTWVIDYKHIDRPENKWDNATLVGETYTYTFDFNAFDGSKIKYNGLPTDAEEDITKFFELSAYTYFKDGTATDVAEIGKTVGTYTVRVTVTFNTDGNHTITDTDETTFVMEAQIVIGEIELDLTNAKWHYNEIEIYTDQKFVANGSGQSPVLGGASAEVLSHVEYKYYVSNGGEVGNELQSAPSTAGTYIVRAVPKAGYKFVNFAAGDCEYEIVAAETELDLANAQWYFDATDLYTNQQFVENGSGQSPVLGGVNADILLHVKYEYYVSNNGEHGDPLAEAPSTAGTYIVCAVPETGYKFVNFTDVEREYTIVEAPDGVIDIDVTGAVWNVDGAPYDDNIVFDGNARNFTLVKDGNALENVTYQYYKQGVVPPELLNAIPSDAGTYIVKVVANSGYRLVGSTDIQSLTYTIDKLRLDNPVTTFTVPTKAEDGKYKLSITYAESDYFGHTVDGAVETTKSGKFTFSVVYTIKNEYKNNVCFTDTQGGDTIEYAETFEWELYTDGKLFDSNKDVTVRDLENYLPKDASLSVTKAQPNLSDYEKELKDKYKDYNAKMGVAYDVHFEDAAHNELDTAGHKFHVTIAIPEELRSYPERRLAVIHIGDDGKIDFIDGAVRVQDNMEFDVDGFSIYAVIALDPVEIGNWWLIVLLVLLAVLVLLALLLRFLRKPEPAPATEQAAAPAESKPEEPVQSAVTESAPAPVVPVAPPVEEISRISFSRSFESRLAQMDDKMKEKYSELKNYLLSHKKVRGRMSWRFESFNKGRNKICKLQFKGKSLMMYIALDPDTLDPKYHHKSLKDKPRFALTPTLLKIKSARSLKYAKELIDMVLQQTDTELRKNFVPVNYVTEYKTTEQLIDEGKIKVKVTHTLQIWEVEAAAAQKAQAPEAAEPAKEEAQAPEAVEPVKEEAQAPEAVETDGDNNTENK